MMMVTSSQKRMGKMWSEIVRLLSMVGALFSMCTSNAFNLSQCSKNWDQWLFPEVKRAWDIKTRRETPYQEEKEVLDSQESLSVAPEISSRHQG